MFVDVPIYCVPNEPTLVLAMMVSLLLQESQALARLVVSRPLARSRVALAIGVDARGRNLDL